MFDKYYTVLDRHVYIACSPEQEWAWEQATRVVRQLLPVSNAHVNMIHVRTLTTTLQFAHGPVPGPLLYTILYSTSDLSEICTIIRRLLTSPHVCRY